MKKIFIIPLTLLLTACSGLLDVLQNGNKKNTNPTDKKVQKILEETYWGTAGFTIPKGYQELGDFHVTLVEGEDYDESAVTDVIFEGNSITFVFPSGGWRTTTYTYDKNSGLMKFDKPLIYGTKNFDGKDVYECHFVDVSLFGIDHISLYDASADDWQTVDINKGQWRMSLAPMDNRQNEKLYEIDCIYGTSYTALNLGIENGASWAYENVDNNKLFPRSNLDFGKIYYGLEYTMPTAEQAQKLIDNCVSLTHKNSKGEEYVMVGNENASLRFPKPEKPGDEMGIWLVGGQALVYSYGEEKTTDGDLKCTLSILSAEETSGRKFFIRPVLESVSTH
ncbi:MAG: hypothetical protein J6K81_05840 [Rikenellaceae bacterium]|nr:hypothetical protein [Rikenellaceae bacterium]